MLFILLSQILYTKVLSVTGLIEIKNKRAEHQQPSQIIIMAKAKKRQTQLTSLGIKSLSQLSPLLLLSLQPLTGGKPIKAKTKPRPTIIMKPNMHKC